MASVWAAGVGRSLAEAVELMRAVVNECPDELWQTSMWHVQRSDIVGEVRNINGTPATDPVERDALIQRWSTPWSVAWHALEVLDYDLNGEFEAWSPPTPFAGNPHWGKFASLPAWSKPQIAGYVDHCRRRVTDTFAAMTEARAESLLPAAHRYAGKPYCWVVTSLIAHTTAHAIQIRQFSTASGLAHK